MAMSFNRSPVRDGAQILIHLPVFVGGVAHIDRDPGSNPLLASVNLTDAYMVDCFDPIDSTDLDIASVVASIDLTGIGSYRSISHLFQASFDERG